MGIIKREVPLGDNIIEYFHEDMLLMDIETLGLSSRFYPIYLIGCMYRKGNTGYVNLFFAENTNEEEAVIRAFTDLSVDFQKMVTFNGLGFDIPYIESRAERFGIDPGLKSFEQIDLYKVAKRHKAILGLTRLRQKSLEEFFGLYREDEYNGGELINVYKQYEKNRDDKLKHLLILHNLEDVTGMSHLLTLLSYDHISKSSFNISSIEYDGADSLLVRGEMSISIPKPIRLLEKGWHMKLSDNRVSGSIKVFSGDLRLYHTNVSDYVYLIEEQSILPKELAGTIPSDRKRKATKEDCFTTFNGLFLPIPPGNKIKSYINLSERKLFRKDYPDKQKYIKLPDPEGRELYEIINDFVSYIFS